MEWFEENGIDFIVLEQGIDTTTPIGRLFFRFLAALAEFEREAIVEGTLEGLASARARGRVGGRPPKLTQVQLDQAQRMYDEDELTVDEIAEAFHVGRSTLYENLAAYKDGGDCVLVVYRNTRPGKVNPDTSRRYGETGQSEAVQLEADRKWWPVAPARQERLKGIVYVVNGTVARIRSVDPEGTWQRDDRGYADIPSPRPSPASRSPSSSPRSSSASATTGPTYAARSASTCPYDPLALEDPMNLAHPIVVVDRRTYRTSRKKITALMDQGEYTRAKLGLTAAMLWLRYEVRTGPKRRRIQYAATWSTWKPSRLRSTDSWDSRLPDQRLGPEDPG